MKKAAAALFLILLFGIFLTALTEANPISSSSVIMEAYADLKFAIRKEPDENSRRIKGVEKREKVGILEVGDPWSKITYEGVTGYCKTKWLYRFRALDPFAAKVPGAQIQAGIAKVITPVHIAVPGYGGNLLMEGNLLSISSWDADGAVIPMMRSTAQIPAEHLSFVPFVPWDKAEPGDIIGGFTTYYNESTGGKKLGANRRWNIDLASSHVHGTVIPSGSEFSYNRLCGDSTKKNGYKLAPNISQDGVGYGGGMCQLTTTIYNAVLGLPIQITQWALHRDSGVAYIPRGFDASVGIYSDFVFINTLPYDIRLDTLTQNGVVTVLISRNTV